MENNLQAARDFKDSFVRTHGGLTDVMVARLMVEYVEAFQITPSVEKEDLLVETLDNHVRFLQGEIEEKNRKLEKLEEAYEALREGQSAVLSQASDSTEIIKTQLEEIATLKEELKNRPVGTIPADAPVDEAKSKKSTKSKTAE